MALRGSLKLDKSWDFLMKSLSPGKLPKVVQAKLRKQMRKNAHLVQRQMRQVIKAGVPPENAALTQAIKGSSKPLVDRGHTIFQGVAIEQVKDFEFFVGIKRTQESYDLAIALHEGATITVTDKMRGLFWVLWQASQGKIKPSDLKGRAAELWERMPRDWYPLSESTTVIRIPARRFMEQAFTPTLARKIKVNIRNAIREGFREMYRGRA